MKHHCRILFYCAFGLWQITFFSCKKIIAIPDSPPSQISTGNVFADSLGAVSAVAGVYTQFGIVVFDQGAPGSGIITQIAGLSGDELDNNIGYDAGLTQFYTNGLLPANSYLQSIWTSAYANIYRINACLEGLDNSRVLSTALKQQLSGEMKVMRAFYYFNLANLFGGVPLVSGTDYKASSYLPKASADSVYQFIITDLQDAQNDLAETYPSDGRVRANAYVAVALLAKVYLYRQQWQDAKDAATRVIQSGIYELETDLNNVFLDGSQEAIWQLPANGLYNQTPEAALFIPSGSDVVPNQSISKSLLNAFEADDQRKLRWMNANTVTTDTTAVYYYPYKYKNVYNPASTTEDYMLLRLADLYLVRAEAAAQTGNLDLASEDLNLIRARAGLQPVAEESKEQELADIMHERQVEMFCEWGNRWFDLKRTGTADAVISAGKPGWNSTDALYPIPLNEIKLNAALVQNPGY